LKPHYLPCDPGQVGNRFESGSRHPSRLLAASGTGYISPAELKLGVDSYPLFAIRYCSESVYVAQMLWIATEG
jgi:hypothetical protein